MGVIKCAKIVSRITYLNVTLVLKNEAGDQKLFNIAKLPMVDLKKHVFVQRITQTFVHKVLKTFL